MFSMLLIYLVLIIETFVPGQAVWAGEIKKNPSLDESANWARTELHKWIHKDAMEIIYPKLQESLGKELLLLNPPVEDEKNHGRPNSSVYRDYILHVREGLGKLVLKVDSISNRDVQSCLIKWAESAGDNVDPQIFAFLKKKGIQLSSDSTLALVDSYIIKNYPETKCARQVAFEQGYFLQTLPSCEEETIVQFNKMLEASEQPLHLSGQKLSTKEKALAYANIAYIGEWAWESTLKKDGVTAKRFQQKAHEALVQINSVFPETKKWNNVRIEALKKGQGSVMINCVEPGD